MNDDLIRRMQRQLGITFIIISHDTAEAKMVAQHIGMLANGRLVAFGTKDEVFAENHPAIHQFFARETQGPIKVV